MDNHLYNKQLLAYIKHTMFEGNEGTWHELLDRFEMYAEMMALDDDFWS